MDTKRIAEMIESKRDSFIKVSDRIWEFAETRFQEYQSAELLAQTLESEGFQVERGVGGIQTAFIGSFGSGTPVVAILGEFDALSGMSQKKGQAKEEPEVPGANGHGCGHNLLGTASLAAAVAVKQYMEENNLPGTVRYYGCPGEEGGSGKSFMARAGLFDDVDFALCWHPMGYNSIMAVESLANYQVYFKFKGKSAHAAASPHLGRSALDAVELMNVGVNYLREHIITDARVHYAITNSGGLSPNVVQPYAEVLYLVRAPKVDQVQEIYERVCKIAKGAAMMTETEVEIVFDKACSNLVQNRTLEEVMYKNYQELGVPVHDEAELQLAKAMRATLSEQEKATAERQSPGTPDPDMVTWLNPYNGGTIPLNGSTDVGDVSWITPTAQCTTACFINGSTLHSWQWVALGATSMAHKGMLHAGKVMAATAVDMLQNPELIAKAKAELKERLGGKEYVCPIPDGVMPSVKK
ncbi:MULTISPECIES: M20 family metallopeptidase [Brevibacillus]|uniref:Aminobenzoyl-glutamate utilization protein B n=1 Tax=Brevibacillus parabrevis TaxID=54914 RepID=A0A4Y3PLN8_BREPA|nr:MULTISPECIES: M20 family metallopeptidase [Brevibacillus]MDH6352831.1 aminobenzoyl-glutamate utilization protein B [Brevibacillus sp. 1238]MED2255090.1 M20 family metallopeptidase [Brevibacillus parabrevis]RNB93068.1 amidohydrolase [Brevibacillus parabrevis]WDV96189.1 M20 family metallopeptidase [Brevibacillus parabrevis]GEB32049.1 aminobenzoyl-glutamate utilization protein B [Brevibacillus parabrevis]